MNFYINELSINGQFADCQSFKKALEPLLRLRYHEKILRECLYCSRSIHSQQVTKTKNNFMDAVRGTNDRLFINQVSLWINKSGPFWDDSRQSNEDDYFEYKGRDVTEQGLGEAARCIIAKITAGLFSFQGSFPEFEKTPVTVQHGLTEAPIAMIDVDNLWTIEQLENILRNIKVFNSWQDVHNEITLRYKNLIFSDDVIASLLTSPFSKQLAKNIFERLDVLSKLVIESNENGELSVSGKELLNKHFVGKKAWFTDESKTNKRKFQKEMTFSDPENTEKNLFCAWHGKIKNPQIRIHFEWPRPAKQKKIKVVYIGPKITKD